MFRELLANEFAAYQLLTSEQLDLLEAHYRLLTQWNAKLNLTRIESAEEAVRLHYCESLFLGTKLPRGNLNIVDVGSGAGFPGVPIAILRPECSVTLVESHQRKAVFLRECTRGLGNAVVVTDRAENLVSSYDWLVSRAVSPKGLRKLQVAHNLALLVGGTEVERSTSHTLIPWGVDRHIVFHVKHPC